MRLLLSLLTTLLLFFCSLKCVDAYSVQSRFHSECVTSNVQPFKKDNDSISLQLTYPSINGTFGVTFFFGGMLGTVPVSFYSDMFQRLSVSSQHVVVAFDFLGGIAKDYMDAGQRVNRAISWFNEHHSELFPEGLKVDMSNAVFVTHSSGIQSILMLWKENLLQQIKALILIDPVDAIFDQVTSDKTKALPRDIHLMVMSTGLCETAALEVPAPWFMNTTKWNLPPIFDEGRLWPSCCPKGLSSGRFLNYLSDHSVLHLNYTQYGHCDLLDDRWVWINNLFRFCKSATDQRLSRRESNVFDLSEFRHNVVAAVSSFTQYALTGSKDRIDEALNTTWAQQNIVINWNKA